MFTNWKREKVLPKSPPAKPAVRLAMDADLFDKFVPVFAGAIPAQLDKTETQFWIGYPFLAELIQEVLKGNSFRKPHILWDFPFVPASLGQRKTLVAALFQSIPLVIDGGRIDHWINHSDQLAAALLRALKHDDPPVPVVGDKVYVPNTCQDDLWDYSGGYATVMALWRGPSNNGVVDWLSFDLERSLQIYPNYPWQLLAPHQEQYKAMYGDVPARLGKK